jgi:type VI secretion system secreted protein VgrG
MICSIKSRHTQSGQHRYFIEWRALSRTSIPVPDAFGADAANGGLANQGFHFHEGETPNDVNPSGDRALHRHRYSDVLNPESER